MNGSQKTNLKINISKTKLMIINNHNDIPTLTELRRVKFKNEIIQRKECFDYLGLSIDQNMNWNEHTKKIRNRLLPIVFALYRIK